MHTEKNRNGIRSHRIYDLAPLTREIALLRSPRGYLYAGLPKFKALFGRDSLITGWELLDWDYSYAVSAIRELSKLQGARIDHSRGEYPGKIPHEFYESDREYEARKKEIPWLSREPNYFSVDSTPLFVILASLIGRKNPHLITRELSKSVQRAFLLLLESSSSLGLLSYVKNESGQGPKSESWRDGIGDILDRLKSPVATVGTQGYLYSALTNGKEFLERRGAGNEVLRSSSENLIRIMPDKLDDYFWNDDLSYFSLAVDGDGVSETAITSDPGHLIFSGILSRNREREVVDRLFEPDLLTDYGIRSLSSLDPRFDTRAYQRGSVWPQDNWIISQGLMLRGYSNEYTKLKDSLLEAYYKMGMMPEYFGVERNGSLIPVEKMRIKPCYPQAWSTGAIINLAIKESNLGREREVK